MTTELKKENKPVSNSVAWKMPKWVKVFVDIKWAASFGHFVRIPHEAVYRRRPSGRCPPVYFSIYRYFSFSFRYLLRIGMKIWNPNTTLLFGSIAHFIEVPEKLSKTRWSRPFGGERSQQLQLTPALIWSQNISWDVDLMHSPETFKALYLHLMKKLKKISIPF